MTKDTDQELLEKAAKAAGIELLNWQERWADYDGPAWRTADIELWNPITDDGDALRLAVKLRLMGGEDSCLVMAMYESGDPYAATRLAIVRAAAAIGEAMP